MGWFSSSLFRRKDVARLLGEMNQGERLHRRLGPLALTGLGEAYFDDVRIQPLTAGGGQAAARPAEGGLP